MTLQLGAYIGEETVDTEFKLYVESNKCSFFSNEEVSKHYETQILNKKKHNLMTINNIRDSLNKYIPKYASNFSQANINGKLILGVSDDGIVEGIPYFGDFSTQIFKNLHKSISQSIRIKGMSDEDKDAWCEKHITVNIKELTVDSKMIDDSWIERLEELKLEHKNRTKTWENYVQRYKNWYKDVVSYSRKVNDLINDSVVRKELLEIESNERIKDKLLSSVPIVLLDDNLEPTDIELVNFLLFYKNLKLSQIHNQKPRRPLKKPEQVFNYIHFSKMICNSRHITYSQGAKFYIIEINFLTQNCKENIQYYDTKNKKWIARKRSVANGNPCCIELS